MKNPKPRAKPYSKGIGTGDPAGAKEKAYLKATYTVFLGRSVHQDGGGFDYWGDPESGSVITVGIKDNWSSAYGDAWHWSDQLRRRPDLETTTEGRAWTRGRFIPGTNKAATPRPKAASSRGYRVCARTTSGGWATWTKDKAADLSGPEADRLMAKLKRAGFEVAKFRGRKRVK